MGVLLIAFYFKVVIAEIFGYKFRLKKYVE